VFPLTGHFKLLENRVSDVMTAKRSEAIALTKENIGHFLHDLPAKARYALAAAVHLPLGSLSVQIPDGRMFRVGGTKPGPNAEVILHNWHLPHRAFSNATIGVAESYIDGDWTSPDITTFLELFLVNQEMGEKLAGGASWFMTAVQRLRHWLNENTLTNSKKNISAHYDLGNAFYSAWLDPSMTYSSALYAEGAQSLEGAQTAKYRALAENMGIKSSDHVLEIGCGWGGFAEYAAKEIGCNVTGLTISRQQLDYASERIFKAGLADKVKIKFQDYRDENGVYNHIASIEMFEAVGERFWPAYFGRLNASLKPGGTAGLQVITISEPNFILYRQRPDFIQRYVFPGGMLPTPQHLLTLGAGHGLAKKSEKVFGADYARTLADWRSRFHVSWDNVRSQGFDERFKRLWEFYLHYCEAGFRSGYIDVRQVVFAKN
jgi:cyclopropane-fatty-acyl-phospholipid synthase